MFCVTFYSLKMNLAANMTLNSTQSVLEIQTTYLQQPQNNTFLLKLT